MFSFNLYSFVPVDLPSALRYVEHDRLMMSQTMLIPKMIYCDAGQPEAQTRLSKGLIENVYLRFNG